MSRCRTVRVVGPVGENDAVCDHCGGALRRGSGDESVAAPDGLASDERANGHADHQDHSGTPGPGQPRREPPDAGRRMLLRAFGGFGVLAGGAVVAFGGDGGTVAPAQTENSNRELAPTASFSFEYDSRDDTVTVTHDGGEAIRVDELFLRGERLGRAGRWDTLGGSASGTTDGVDAVVSGDSTEAEVRQSDYALRVVWQSQDTGRSAELAEDRGPRPEGYAGGSTSFNRAMASPDSSSSEAPTFDSR